MKQHTRLIYSNILHEQAPNALTSCLITTAVPLSGDRWVARGSASSEHHFMLRISRTHLINLYNQICRGSFVACERVALLYECGLALPQSDLNKMLWTEIAGYDAVQLPDSALFTKKDLRSVLKEHMRSVLDCSVTYIPSDSYLKMMKSISEFKIVDGPVKSCLGKSFVRVQADTYDMYCVYKKVAGQTKLVSAFLNYVDSKQKEKFVDFTYQASNIVPANLPEGAFGKSDQYYVVYGKLERKEYDPAMDYASAIHEWIIHDVDRLAEIYRERADRRSPYIGFLEKYREKKAKAVLFLSEFDQLKRPTRRQINMAEGAKKLLAAYEEKREANRELRKKAREVAKANDPVNLFWFKAIDLFICSNSNEITSTPPSVKHAQIMNKLKSLGFVCCDSKTAQSSSLESRKGKNGTQPVVRISKPKMYWQKA